MQTDPENLVELDDVSFGFSERLIFDKVNIAIPRGRITVIMGPSGCGKSTLLNFIGGRLKPQAGAVSFDSTRVDKLGRGDLYAIRKRMGMMFQSNALLTDISVFENVAFPIREHTDLPEPLIRNLVLLKLEMVGLRGAHQLMPDELSGGMARRVALARAIALDPDLIMYDEPFTGLDPISLGVTVKLIKTLNDALGITSVVVTHDVDEGCSIADFVYILGGGNVLGMGTPQELFASPDDNIRQFMKGLPDGPVAFHYPAPDISSQLLEK